ncbi:hypothetical protein [Alicyclobacillus cycloheptanicus]|uniref:Uncharacterized protein n=1 Tax=Alicyclobacillus cycloheptanicus TaxID=1457 RepID=A0ABT9XG42_9BACL|nr:hypothetical protein [Alicyclobacillus cycloheptanicus]
MADGDFLLHLLVAALVHRKECVSAGETVGKTGDLTVQDGW